MSDSPTLRREGMMATVRNRRALVTRVKPFATSGEQMYLVDVEYTDLDGGKPSETLLWNREVGARLTEPSALPRIHDEPPMPPRDFDALVRASRWSAWYRFLDGTREPEPASERELLAARRATEEDLSDDLEKQGRERHASRTAGAWLKPLLGQLQAEIEAVTAALEGLGLRVEGEHVTTPKLDARFDRLLKLIDQRIRNGRVWRDDERLIVFTEYKTTLDDLCARLIAHYQDNPEHPERVRLLYGGLDMAERTAIKNAFNDPADPVRVLLATDAASEGLNLQETACLLLHYEIPWNPSRLEQRNGRLDRHGQARDVTTLPTFRTKKDASINASIYSRVPVLQRDDASSEDGWKTKLAGMFHMSNDSELFIGQPLPGEMSRDSLVPLRGRVRRSGRAARLARASARPSRPRAQAQVQAEQTARTRRAAATTGLDAKRWKSALDALLDLGLVAKTGRGIKYLAVK